MPLYFTWAFRAPVLCTAFTFYCQLFRPEHHYVALFSLLLSDIHFHILLLAFQPRAPICRLILLGPDGPRCLALHFHFCSATFTFTFYYWLFSPEHQYVALFCSGLKGPGASHCIFTFAQRHSLSHFNIGFSAQSINMSPYFARAWRAQVPCTAFSLLLSDIYFHILLLAFQPRASICRLILLGPDGPRCLALHFHFCSATFTFTFYYWLFSPEHQYVALFCSGLKGPGALHCIFTFAQQQTLSQPRASSYFWLSALCIILTFGFQPRTSS